MNHEDAIKRLRALRDEAATLPPSTGSAEFNSWEPRTRSALTRALGEKHYITQRFIKTKWTPSAYGLGDTIAFTSTFRGTVPEAQGILDAAPSPRSNCSPKRGPVRRFRRSSPPEGTRHPAKRPRHSNHRVSVVSSGSRTCCCPSPGWWSPAPGSIWSQTRSEMFGH